MLTTREHSEILSIKGLSHKYRFITAIRERENHTYIYMFYVCTFIYVYIYIYVCVSRYACLFVWFSGSAYHRRYRFYCSNQVGVIL